MHTFQRHTEQLCPVVRGDNDGKATHGHNSGCARLEDARVSLSARSFRNEIASWLQRVSDEALNEGAAIASIAFLMAKKNWFRVISMFDTRLFLATTPIPGPALLEENAGVHESARSAGLRRVRNAKLSVGYQRLPDRLDPLVLIDVVQDEVAVELPIGPGPAGFSAARATAAVYFTRDSSGPLSSGANSPSRMGRSFFFGPGLHAVEILIERGVVGGRVPGVAGEVRVLGRPVRALV